MKNFIEDYDKQFLYLPLEVYEPFIQREESDALKALIDTFSFTVYGNLRNAIHFLQWVKEHDLIDIIRNQVHFVMDGPTSGFLENEGIPAIMPRINARPIDIMEFMLRISRDGKTLYPKPADKAEEMPGLLHELQMPVAEFTVCREKHLEPGRLKQFREKLDTEEPQAVLLHNRSSITRIKTAFPDLNLHKRIVLAGSAGVTNELIQTGIEPDFEAEGSWPSIQKIIREEFLT